MNNRQKKIIRELAEYENNTIANLSSMLCVSYRTIQNDIIAINYEIKKYEVTIVTATNKGVKIEAKDSQNIEKLLQNINDETYDNETLVLDLLQKILLTDNYVKLDEMYDQINESKKVIRKSIRNLKTLLDRYNLKIFSKPSYGSKVVAIEGSTETKIRKLILDVRNSHYDFYPLVFDINQNIEAEEIIRNLICKSNYVTNEESLSDLINGIKIASTRIKQGKMIDYEQAVINYLVEIDEFGLSQQLCDRLNKIYKIEYDVGEIAYIARIMRAHRRITENEMNNLENVIRDDLDRLINEIFDTVENVHHIDFHDDIDLYVALGMHLVPLVSRIKFNFHVNNPIIGEVKRNYMLAFEIALTVSTVIEKNFDIKLSENEIGYIAVHFNLAIERQKANVCPKNILVVCSSGGGLSKLLEFKIKQSFGAKVGIVNTCNMYELKTMDTSKYDYILTTVKLDYSPNKPTLFISHMLSEVDVDNLSITLREENDVGLLDVVSEDIFFNDINTAGMTEAIEMICERLRGQIPLQVDFEKQVLEREKLYSTAIGNNVAFPHPLLSTTPVTFISVTVLKKPIRWNDEAVQVIMVGNVKTGDSNRSQLMYEQFARFVSNKNNLIELIKTPKYEVFKKIIERM